MISTHQERQGTEKCAFDSATQRSKKMLEKALWKEPLKLKSN